MPSLVHQRAWGCDKICALSFRCRLGVSVDGVRRWRPAFLAGLWRRLPKACPHLWRRTHRVDRTKTAACAGMAAVMMSGSLLMTATLSLDTL